MSFDKKLYWKNRNEGKRGQGEYTVPEPTQEYREKYMAKGLFGKNRIQRRREDHLGQDKRARSKTAAISTMEQDQRRLRIIRLREAGEKGRIMLKRQELAGRRVHGYR